jgi:hypothetical protein
VALPGGVGHETVAVYEARETREPRTDEVASCDFYPLQSRDCAVANYLAEGNTIRYDVAADGATANDDLALSYDYVQTYGNDWYRPASLTENETLVLGLEPVTRERVLSDLSEEWDEARPVVRRAVENGTARTTDIHEPDPRTTYYVERDDEFYTIRLVGEESVPTGWGWKAPPDWLVDLLRIGGWLDGVATLVTAGRVGFE